MKFKKILKKIPGLNNKYQEYKHNLKFEKNANVIFETNKKNSSTLVVILAGYKELLWGKYFDRIKKYIPDEFDICIVSSGMFSEKLNKIADENGWCYLPTKRNNVCVSLNTAINAFPEANRILKIDEDIFITKNMVKNMINTYNHPISLVNPGFVAPIIPINGFGHVEVLKRYKLLDEFSNEFEPVKYAAGPMRQIESNPKAAKFFWDPIRFGTIDDMAEVFGNDKISDKTCPIRFSIGVIYFSRKIWKDMNYFTPSKSGADMGADEEQIDTFSMINSRPMLVSLNSVAGHLSFGKQNSFMLSYFKEHMELF